jgi:hypothetical protein
MSQVGSMPKERFVFYAWAFGFLICSSLACPEIVGERFLPCAFPHPAGSLGARAPASPNPLPFPAGNECFRMPGKSGYLGMLPTQSAVLGCWELDLGYGFRL